MSWTYGSWRVSVGEGEAKDSVMFLNVFNKLFLNGAAKPFEH